MPRAPFLSTLTHEVKLSITFRRVESGKVISYAAGEPILVNTLELERLRFSVVHSTELNTSEPQNTITESPSVVADTESVESPSTESHGVPQVTEDMPTLANKPKSPKHEFRSPLSKKDTTNLSTVDTPTA